MADGGKGWLQSLFTPLIKSAAERPKVTASLAPNGPAKGLLVDPMAVQRSGSGFYYRPTSLSYEALRAIAYNTPIVKAIIQTRIGQVQSFARRPKHDFDIGLRVRLKDPTAKMTAGAKKQAAFIEDFILQCGVPGRDRVVTDDNFRTFTAKVVRDMMVFDQGNWQNQYRRDGKPYAMIAMPALSMRVAERESEVNRDLQFGQTIEPTDLNAPRYVQIYQNTVIAEFTPREMAWLIRNPVTDLDHFGYGWSEIENMLPVIQALVWAEQYNRKFFSQGSVIKGLLNIKGDVPQRQLEQFRNEWHSLVSGIENAFRTPVVASKEGVEFLEMHSNNRDMEYAEWVNHCIREICAGFAIASDEIGISFGNVGQSKSMFENSAESKLKWSRDRGLRPLLNTYEDGLNSHIVQQIDPDFVLEFYGLDVEDEKDRLAMVKDYVSHVLTVDEGRKMLGREPLPDGSGAIILSPVWQQMKQLQDANKQQADGAAPDVGGGGPDAPPEFSPDDFGDPNADEPQAGGEGVDPAADQESGIVDEKGKQPAPDVQKSLNAAQPKRKTVRITTIEV